MTSLVFDTYQAGDGSLVFDSPVYAGAVAPVVDEEFDAWLESDDAIVNVLVETSALIDGVETQFFWSTCGYTSEGIDNPIFYEPVINAGVSFTDALSLGGGAGVSASELEIDNTDGIRGYLENYVWKSLRFTQLIGDVRWNRADYRVRFVGVIAGLIPKTAHTLVLRLRDMTERLNAAMTDHKLGGETANRDTIIPLAFGEMHNVTGLLSDPATLEFAFHDGAIERIDVRANALPVEALVDLEAGRSQLAVDNQSAAITASVQGDKFGGVYRNTVGALVERIVTGYGKESDRYTSDDIDAENFGAFEDAHQQPVGMFVNDRTNLLVGCDALASSLGAQLIPAREGELQLVQVAIPAPGISMDIRPEHMVPGTLKPVQHFEPIAAVKLGFCRNWTVQAALTTAIPAEHRALYETEWLTATAVDLERAAALKLEIDPPQRNTMLLRRVDAQAEAERLLALWGPGRDVYEFEGMPITLRLRAGQPITVYSDYFGMSDGVEAQVVSITPNYKNRRAIVRFLA